MKNIYIIALTIALGFSFVSANHHINKDHHKANQALPTTEFTVKDLATHTGTNGNPAYVAVDGIVYDATNYKPWKDGKHKNGITAGQDLTKRFTNDAQHNRKFLEKLAKVLVLVSK